MSQALQFPMFRKYPDNRTYFKIHSYEEFQEVKIMGGFYQVHDYQAEKLPDRNLIADMIDEKDQFWEAVSETEFEAFLNYCQANLRKLD